MLPKIFPLFDFLIFWLSLDLMVVICVVNTTEYFYILGFFSLKYNTTTHLLFNTKDYTFIPIIQSYWIFLTQNSIQLYVSFKDINRFPNEIRKGQSLQFWYPVFCHKILLTNDVWKSIIFFLYSTNHDNHYES
jgi:hypothetical protein